MTITKAQIEKRAYELYLARGREDGKALNDWLEAKLDLVLESLEQEKNSNGDSGNVTVRQHSRPITSRPAHLL